VWVPQNKYRAVGMALSAARKRAGLSQKQLAIRLAKPQSFVQTTRGQRRIDVLELILIAEGLKCDPRGNVFSKRIENHALSVAFHYMHYNFCRIHKSLRVTPAMAAGVTDGVWDMSDVAALIAAQDASVAKRGPYKKRAA
jgi:transcriptional regulator with XRE-family HTH domain